MPDADVEQVVRDTFPTAYTWRLRVQQAYYPAPGSELADDDKDWPWAPASLSQLSWTALAASRDHLGAVIEQIEAGIHHPFAHRSLLRTALLGAAQAVWLLAPDARLTRLERARTVATETYDKHHQFLKEQADRPDLDAVERGEAERVRDHVAHRRNELQAIRNAAGQTRKFESTHIIRVATTEALGLEYATHAILEWRRASGAAHGLSWAPLGLPATKATGPADGDGVAEFAATGDVASIANIYMLAYHLNRYGWQKLDQRGAG